MPTIMHDSLVRGTIVTSTEIIRDGWVAITGERIAAMGTGEMPPAAVVLDYTGKRAWCMDWIGDWCWSARRGRSALPC